MDCTPNLLLAKPKIFPPSVSAPSRTMNFPKTTAPQKTQKRTPVPPAMRAGRGHGEGGLQSGSYKLNAFLLRCPVAASPVKAGLRLTDRCHSLPSFSPPLAAVGSLPPCRLFGYFLGGTRKYPSGGTGSKTLFSPSHHRRTKIPHIVHSVIVLFSGHIRAVLPAVEGKLPDAVGAILPDEKPFSRQTAGH